MSITLIITYNQKENINYRKEVKPRYDMGLVLFVCFLNFCAFGLKTTYNPLRAHNLDRMDGHEAPAPPAHRPREDLITMNLRMRDHILNCGYYNELWGL